MSNYTQRIIIKLKVNNMRNIDIGFVEECEPWKLKSRFFPSKIGGKPAWLNLKNIPDKDKIACEYCKDPCIFLCQVYAPYEEDDKAFHRTLYLFICKNPNCCKTNQNGNLKVFRSQLERRNEFYPLDPPEEDKDWKTDIHVEKWTKTCHVCGISSTKHCAKCKKTNYCCRVHQVLDWKNGHKNLCGTEKKIEFQNFLFPEFEIIVEAEENEEETNSELGSQNNDLEKNRQEVEKYEELVKSGQAGSLQAAANVDSDLINMASKVEDETFFEFQNRIKNDTDQVLRYDRGGSPLYISSTNQAENIPKCEGCNSERQFEFQIMPQLINHLNFEDPLNSLDWGIIAVFTCKISCVPKNGYVSEWVWKQDIDESRTDNASENKSE